MKLAGLQARQRRRRTPGSTCTSAAHGIAPNHPQRQFEADAPNQKWVADVTYIWAAEGWLLVAAVMDLFSRRIVGWSTSDTMQARMVADALLMALWHRGRPAELIHHSDQGSQYTSDDFQSSLKQEGIPAARAAEAIWRASLVPRKRSGSAETSIAPGMRLGQMCSITPSASTIRIGGIQH